MRTYFKTNFFIDTSHHFVRLFSLQTDNHPWTLGISPSQISHLDTPAAPDPNAVIHPLQLSLIYGTRVLYPNCNSSRSFDISYVVIQKEQVVLNVGAASSRDS